ncbi:putative E3 ubiquitin-protein ligase RF298 [Olea europaea var. sylvestris]|uniref:E3 ubiquitin- ligase RF298 n=1 Tax=Olea europaea subsp. europaea TaxID=158383 RepID=A0A8S0PJ49_OLEEU|nr:putative E3 ubiquitin-protein ligase RF298 [Olea europaea var. sylvestris]CAA2940092.1 E3 ubiquitin- ligase RF298 [Olea europaea subsp. europaea]
MGVNGNVHGNGEGSSDVSATEKGSRNKRKLLSDLVLDNPIDVSTFSLTEFPRYELLEEKFRNALSELGSLVSRSEKIVAEPEVEEFHPSDWDDPFTCQLEKILTSNLLATFRSAVKKIVECGYNEETAEWVILNCSIYHGRKDAVSNVVDGVLALLKREKEFNFPRLPVFQDLQSLAEYTMLEMIHVVREVKPSLTIVEAMWRLLLCDLNLLYACAVEQDSLGYIGGICGPEVLGGNSESSFPESKPKLSDTSSLITNKPHNPKQSIQSSQPKNLTAGAVSQLPNSKISRSRPKKGSSSSFQDARGKFSGITKEHIRTSSQATVLDEKSGGSRTGLSGNSKRDMLRQKSFNFEKSYKGCVSKGAFKAKVAAWGNMVLDKTLKSQSDSSSIAMKSHPPSCTLPVKDTRTLPIKDNDHALPALYAKSPASSESELSSNTKIDKSGPSSATDYYAAIPYDESLQNYIPQDDKEETLLILVPHKQALEKELQGWTDWANEKVMQAARRLRKDRGELKILRQEKEETEKFKEEKQILEENTMKRLSEMEYALSNATGQIEVANSAVQRLEEENSVLRKEMEAAKLQALGSATNLQEAMLREQEALKKSKSWDMEKDLFLEQRTKLKRLAADLQNQLKKTKERKDNFKILWRQEEQEKRTAVSHIDSFKKKREEEDALAKAEEDDLKQVAELDVQKCKDDIKKLENMISELRFESEASKIAALKRGIDPGYASTFQGSHGTGFSTFQDKFGAGSVKPERECVMCMTEEISVVFLPCAHQVLCTQCNVLHEKQGMNDCPSCRTLIQKRIAVCYRNY